MRETNTLLDSVELYCLPDYSDNTSVIAFVAVQTASGFLWAFEPLPATILTVQSYLRCRCGRLPVSPSFEQSWDSFYKQYQSLIRWVVAKSCRPAERDDLGQEIWTEIVVELPKLLDGHIRGGFSFWLVGLARRKIGRLLGRHGCSLATETSPVENYGLVSPELGPEEEFLLKEMSSQLDSALAKLRRRTSPKNYELFCHKFLGGQSAKQIGDALGLTPNEIKCRYRRLKRKFRAFITETAMAQWVSDLTASDNSTLPMKPR